MNNTSRTTKKTGFTLIELLVVIAIISLLAAILFPVFSRAREKARSASCQSNLKSIALGFAQYNLDYDGRFPHAWDMNPLSAAGTTTTSGSGMHNALVQTPTDLPVFWPAKILPYTKSQQIYTCPSAPFNKPSPCNATYTRRAMRWGAGERVIESGSTIFVGAGSIGYGYNASFLGGGQFIGDQGCAWDNSPNYLKPSASNPYNNGIGAMETSIAEPSKTILVLDNGFTRNGNLTGFRTQMPMIATPHGDKEGDVSCNAAGGEDREDSLELRHTEGLNVAFVDGHVKWMRKEAVLYRPSDSDYCRQGALSTDPDFIWNRN